MSTMFSGCSGAAVGTAVLQDLPTGEPVQMFSFDAKRGHNYRFAWHIKVPYQDDWREMLAGAGFAGEIQWVCGEGDPVSGRIFDLNFGDEPDHFWYGWPLFTTYIGYNAGFRTFSLYDRTCDVRLILNRATGHFLEYETTLLVYEETPKEFAERISGDYIAPSLMIIGGLLGLFGLVWIVRGLVLVYRERKTATDNL